jgi:hypothetical protein
MRTIFVILIICCCLLPLTGVPVLAQDPVPPCAFWGSVTINRSPAPVGTQIEAKGTGVLTGIKGNPFIVTEAGQYGDESGLSPKLIAQGVVTEGTEITFLVNEKVAQHEPAFWHSGEVTSVNLTVVTSSSGGGGGSTSPQVNPSGFSVNTPLKVNSSGVLQAAAKLLTADGKLTLDISKGTKLLSSSNSPLTSLKVMPLSSPPQAPDDTAIVLAYTFSPDGAKFDPALTLKIAYDPVKLPSGVAERDLYIAWFDGAQWQKLETTVDQLTKIVTAKMAHFSSYALMGKVSLPPAATNATPALTPTPSSIQTPVPSTPSQATPPSTAAPPADFPPSASPSAILPPTTPSPTPAPSVNWLLIIGLFVAVIIIGLIGVWIIKRRR